MHDTPFLHTVKTAKITKTALCIGPHVDAILLGLSPVLRLHPRWCPCASNLVWWCPSNFSLGVPAFSCSPSVPTVYSLTRYSGVMSAFYSYFYFISCIFFYFLSIYCPFLSCVYLEYDLLLGYNYNSNKVLRVISCLWCLLFSMRIRTKYRR